MKLSFRDDVSRYFLGNLLQDSVPPSDNAFNLNPELDPRINSSECANSLCKVGAILAQGNESNIQRSVSWHNFPNSRVLTLLLEFSTLSIAASWLWIFVNAGRWGNVIKDMTHLRYSELSEKAFRSTFPIDFVRH